MTPLVVRNPHDELLPSHVEALGAALPARPDGEWGVLHAWRGNALWNGVAPNDHGALLQASANPDAIALSGGAGRSRVARTARRGVAAGLTARRCTRSRRFRREWASMVALEVAVCGLSQSEGWRRQGNGAPHDRGHDQGWSGRLRSLGGSQVVDRPALPTGWQRAATTGADAADGDRRAGDDAPSSRFGHD